MTGRLSILGKHFVKTAIDHLPERKRYLRFRAHGVRYCFDLKEVFQKLIDLDDELIKMRTDEGGQDDK